MSELSDNAQSLAETLCGSDFRHCDGILTREETIDGRIFETIRYDREKLLSVARAALELAGEKIDLQVEKDGEVTHQVYLGQATAAVVVTNDGEMKIDVAVYKSLSAKEATHLTAILLHAAATAGEWESEGK